MKSKEIFAKQITRKVVQTIVHRERTGWPPDSPWGCYQPRRPDLPNQDMQTKR